MLRTRGGAEFLRGVRGYDAFAARDPRKEWYGKELWKPRLEERVLHPGKFGTLMKRG